MEFRYIADGLEIAFLLDSQLLAFAVLFVGLAVAITAVLKYGGRFDKKTKRVYKRSVARPQGEKQDANN